MSLCGCQALSRAVPWGGGGWLVSAVCSGRCRAASTRAWRGCACPFVNALPGLPPVGVLSPGSDSPGSLLFAQKKVQVNIQGNNKVKLVRKK